MANPNPKPKLPLHEVLSAKLNFALDVGLGNAGPTLMEGFISLILSLLFEGDLKASHAHELAERHADAPELLSKAGLTNLAEFAQKVLDDLDSRVDTPKVEAMPTATDHSVSVN